MVIKNVRKYLKNKIKEMEYYNNMSPFPVYDTGYIEYTKNKLKEMSKHKKEYDEIPVAACKYCNSLYILNDEVENDICARCGSINEIVIYQDIKTYLEYNEEK